MIISNHDYCYHLELTEDIDFFDIILQIQQDIRRVFKYDEDTKRITVISIHTSDAIYDERVMNTPLWKNGKYGTNGSQYKYPHLLIEKQQQALQKNETHITLGDFKSNGDFVEDDYTHEEIHNMIKDKADEFNTACDKYIPFTEDENKFISELRNHPLIKNIIKKSYWVDYVYLS